MMSGTTHDATRQNRTTERVQDHSDSATTSGLLSWLRLEPLAKTKFGELFGADLRSLAVLRIALAFIVIMDVVARVSDVRVHYSDEGVFPRSLLVDNFVRWRWSLNLINDTVEFQMFLLLVTLVAAVCMMLGYHTRLMVVAVWILVVSLQVRNPFVLSGADSLLRVLLFWSMFLPLGAAWSLDARRNPVDPRPYKRTLSLATIGVFLQICFMYWFTAALKSSPEWRSDGTALYYALGANHITKPFGEYLHQFPELLRILTHASLGLEIVAPILLFSPFLTGPVRTLAAGSIMAFHVGIYLTMDVGIFPWTSALCMTCFLPSWFWDEAVPWVQTRVPSRIQGVTLSLRSAWRAAQQSLVPLWSRVEQAGLTFSTAGGARAGFGSVEPERVTRSRATESSSEQTVSRTSAAAISAHPLANVFLAFCLVVVFLWNWTSVSNFRVPSEIVPFGYASGLYQKWNMFAPHPSKGTVWIVVRGVLADGREVDLLTPIVQGDLTQVPALSWEQPSNIVGDYYGNKYWRKYLTAITQDNKKDERREFAAYACRTWNGYYGGDVRLDSLQIFKLTERTLPDYEDAPTVRSTVAQYRCR